MICPQEEEAARQEAREEQERKDEEAHYWERVLGDSYALHLGELQREQEEIAKSLGKGKRIRKQINYAEQDGTLKVGGATEGVMPRVTGICGVTEIVSDWSFVVS